MSPRTIPDSRLLVGSSAGDMQPVSGRVLCRSIQLVTAGSSAGLCSLFPAGSSAGLCSLFPAAGLCEGTSRILFPGKAKGVSAVSSLFPHISVVQADVGLVEDRVQAPGLLLLIII